MLEVAGSEWANTKTEWLLTEECTAKHTYCFMLWIYSPPQFIHMLYLPGHGKHRVNLLLRLFIMHAGVLI